MERLDLSLAGSRDVAEEDARDEHGEEARPVCDRGEPVDDSGSGQHADGVQRRAREPNPPHHGQEQHRAGNANGEPDRHFDDELLDHDRERAALLGGELDHPDHQRDTDRVVGAGFALEDRSRPTADLATAEHGERDRWIRRSDRRADQSGHDPREAEEIVPDERDETRGGERADDAENEDRSGGAPKAADADVESAVEEDDDERDDADALDGLDGQGVAQRFHGRGEEARGDEEERGVGERDPVGDTGSENGQEHASGDDEDDDSEVGDLGHERNLGIYGARRGEAVLQSPYRVLMLDSR